MDRWMEVKGANYPSSTLSYFPQFISLKVTYFCFDLIISLRPTALCCFCFVFFSHLSLKFHR